jgi:hypothetical protein
MHTPWGASQNVTPIADGITVVSTAGHGGAKLSPERHAAIQKRFPNFTTFAGGSWYEEDADIQLVVYCFPDLFLSKGHDPKMVERCGEYVKRSTEYFGTEVTTGTERTLS